MHMCACVCVRVCMHLYCANMCVFDNSLFCRPPQPECWLLSKDCYQPETQTVVAECEGVDVGGCVHAV